MAYTKIRKTKTDPLTTSKSISGKSMRSDWKTAPKNKKTVTPRKNKDE